MNFVLGAFDPRGRCNCGTFAIMMILVLPVLDRVLGTVLSGIGLSGVWGVSVGFVVVSVGLTLSIIAKRTQDLGYSGWYGAAGYMLVLPWVFFWVFAPVFAYSAGSALLGSGLMIVAFVATIPPILYGAFLLFFKEGEPGPNEFGPQPKELGFVQHPQEISDLLKDRHYQFRN